VLPVGRDPREGDCCAQAIDFSELIIPSQSKETTEELPAYLKGHADSTLPTTSVMWPESLFDETEKAPWGAFSLLLESHA